MPTITDVSAFSLSHFLPTTSKTHVLKPAIPLQRERAAGTKNQHVERDVAPDFRVVGRAVQHVRRAGQTVPDVRHHDGFALPAELRPHCRDGLFREALAARDVAVYEALHQLHDFVHDVGDGARGVGFASYIVESDAGERCCGDGGGD